MLALLPGQLIQCRANGSNAERGPPQGSGLSKVDLKHVPTEEEVRVLLLLLLLYYSRYSS